MSFEKFHSAPDLRCAASRQRSARVVLISFDAATVETFGLDTASYAVLYFDKTRKWSAYRSPRIKAMMVR